MPPRNTNANDNERWRLAQSITIMSMAGLVIVASVAIFFSENRAETSQMVFTAVVPLLASWVGAVLAYYYSSKSLESATNSVKELVPVEDRLRSIPAVDVMIKVADMAYFPPDDSQKVQDILDKLKATGKGERLPFLNDKKHPVYMLHKSYVDSALLRAGSEIAIDTVTLKELFEKVPDLKVIALGTFGTLGEDATLETVRTVMGFIKNCQDVYITKDGTKDSPVLGWITNVILEENSKL
jgi:hypothetical protein